MSKFVALAFCRADLLFELDATQKVVFTAGACDTLLGASSDALIGKEFCDLIANKDQSLARQILKSATSSGRMDDVLVRLKGPGESEPIAALSGYRNPDFGDHFFLALKQNPVGFADAAKASDVERDGDSGLMNAESFSDLATDRVQSLQRAGGTAQITLVKVDKLEKTLERLGASDRVSLLKSIGEILNTKSLGGDTASRLEGEAFSFLHGDDVEAETINEEIEKAAQALGVGGAGDEEGGLEARSQTLVADGAGMSEDQVAKVIIHVMQQFCEGGGAVKAGSLSEALGSMVESSIENIAFLRQSISDRAFSMKFMPICELRKEKIHHFEALMRFEHEEFGGSPYALIRLAEETDLVHDLDMAVVRKSMRMVNEFCGEEIIPPVAINLSGKSLDNDAFVLAFTDLLNKSRAMSDRILFEITESARIENLSKVNQIIQSWRALGFKFCLDDFGAGAASFDYLNALEIDIVKFDGPVVRRAYQSDRGSKLLSSITKMCEKMGVQTVAEMVEDKAMARIIYYCGVDLGQGWYFGKPIDNPLDMAENYALRLKR